MTRRLGRSPSMFFLLAGLAVALLGSALPARAHARLADTSPAHGTVVEGPPAQIELRFNEPVSVSSTVLRSGDTELAGSARLEGSTVVFEPGRVIPDGTAVLQWQVVSADGHPIGGTLVFHVRVATEGEVVQPEVPVNAGLIGANALMYVGLVLGGGLGVFAVHVLDGETGRAALRRLTVGLLCLGAVGTMITIALRGTGGPFDLTTLPAGAVPAVAAAALGSALAIVGRANRTPVTVGVGLALLAPVLTGHTRSFEPGWLMMISDTIHLYAAAVWAGGLAGIALITRHSRTGMGGLVSRFSRLAAWSLAIVLASGLTLAWTLHRSWASLTGTDHGRLILVKVGLVLIVAAVGAFNRFRLIPALKSAGANVGRLLSNTTAIEAAGLVLVLVVAAALVDKDPAGAAAPVEAQGPVQTGIGDLLLTVELDPGARGVNEARIIIRTPSGERAELIDDVSVAVIGEGDRTTFDAAEGDGAQVALIDIPGSGEWRIEVRAREDAFTEAVAIFAFDSSTGRLTPTTGLLVAGAVMPALSGAPTTAVYMSVISAGDDQLVGAFSPACDDASIHETVIAADGTSSMGSRSAIALHAGEPLRLESGGLHIMCEGPSAEVGDTVPFSITTAAGESLEFLVPVVSITDTLG